MLPELADHLYQSTVFAAAAGLLVLVLRKYSADARHWIWLVASLKFLVPFSLLTGLGSVFPAPPAAALPRAVEVAQEISRPFTVESFSGVLPVTSPAKLPVWLAAVWCCGFVAVLCFWLVRWRRIQAALHQASPLPLKMPIPVVASPTLLEPGVFGIFRPVLVLPEGIWERLGAPQFEAILAHELCHVRRRDNLWAAIHMVVEALFWFHPLVWWLGARLVDERERACDEEVVRMGSEPQAYAEGILNVCKFYLQSPLPCASGITGSNLKRRIETIMANRISRRLSFAGKLLLAGAGTVAIAAPILVGVWHAPPASIRPAAIGKRRMLGLAALPGGGFEAHGIGLHRLITNAYNVHGFQVRGGPPWMGTELWDIKAPGRPAKRLLADRFGLRIHRETINMAGYSLIVAPAGHKLQPPKDENINLNFNGGRITADGASMGHLAGMLAEAMGRPVADQTGLTGRYQFKVQWTPDGLTKGPPKFGGPVIQVDSPDPSGSALFPALQDQLGLRLEPRNTAVEIIVVDHAERPSEN